MRYVLIGIGVLILFILLIVGGVFGNIELYRHAAPRMQNAQHQVFKQTQSYIDGKVEILNKARMEYVSANEEGRAALRQIILDEAASVDENRLPPDLQSFINKLRGGF
jgi:hypothetical protein